MSTSRIISACLIFLLCLSAFCVLYAMGALNFIDPQPSEFYNRYQAMRVEAVTRAPYWRIVAEVSEETIIGREVLHGMRTMVKRINASGGVLGKELQFEVVKPGTATDAHVQMTHEASRDMSTALLLGPWRGNHVPASRAIAQYYALPMITTTPSDNLPPLTPDNCLSLLLPQEYWFTSLSEHLVATGRRRVLILGPDKQHSGGIYASRSERALGALGQFEELFRVVYTPPMSPQAVYKSLRLYQENRAFDVLLFTDEVDELAVLGPVFTKLGIKVPVYGFDQFNARTIQPTVSAHFPAGIYYPRLTCAFLSQQDLQNSPDISHETPCQWMQYGMLSVRLFSDALVEQRAYHPEKIVAAMRRLLHKSQSAPQAVTVTMERVYE